jgi:hypothetical protein
MISSTVFLFADTYIVDDTYREQAIWLTYVYVVRTPHWLLTLLERIIIS